MTPNSSLLQWLSTFQLDGKASVELKDDAYYNLADGYVSARILNQISPQYFSDKWLDGIKPVPPNGSWRLRVSNLKRILQKIYDYASDLQSLQFRPSAITPDVGVIAQNFDPDQISRLIQLILFCAINCDKKQDYIERIRNLPTPVKQDIKEAIEELLVRNDDSFNQKLNNSHLDSDKDVDTDVTSSGQKFTPSSSQSSPYRSPANRVGERLKLMNEYRRHSQEYDITNDTKDLDYRLKNLEKENSDQLILQQYKKLQTELQCLKEELIKVESDKEEYRLKSNLFKDDLEKLTLKHDELKTKAEQAKRLQDELDEHRHVSEKVTGYETMVENLMKKNNDLKKELKSVTEKNLSHVQKIVTLEEDNSQLINTINMVEIYKKQLQDAQAKLALETHRADKAELELARLNERYSATKNENEKLYETTNQLIRTSSANIMPKETGRSPAQNKFEMTNSGNAKFLEEFDAQQCDDTLNSIPISTIELKERIARLEAENRLLESKVASKKENDQSVLSGLLEAANVRCSKLESENRQSRKKLLMLESRFQDITSSQNGASTSAAINNDSNLDNSSAYMNRIEELQRRLFEKERELMESETKYQKSLHKARGLIKTLNNNQSTSGSLIHPSCISSTSSFNSNSLDETNLLKQQLKNREDRLIEMEREFYEFKKIKEVHERLTYSAFYSLTTSMQWKNAEKRLERTTLTSPPNSANSSMNNFKHSH